MMEFTISRVALGMCGIILLAAVLSPVTGLYDGKETVEMQEQTDNIAKMVDSFYLSEADNMTLNMGEILPSTSVSLKVDGNMITIVSDEDEFRSATRFTIASDEEIYGPNDIVRFTKTDNGVMTEKIA